MAKDGFMVKPGPGILWFGRTGTTTPGPWTVAVIPINRDMNGVVQYVTSNRPGFNHFLEASRVYDVIFPDGVRMTVMTEDGAIRALGPPETRLPWWLMLYQFECAVSKLDSHRPYVYLGPS